MDAGDFLYGKEAYQYYLDHKRYLDEIEREQLQPQINALRQRLVEKKAQVDTAVAKARGIIKLKLLPSLCTAASDQSCSSLVSS